MLGFKRFGNAANTISGIELLHRIRKGQFGLAGLRFKDTAAPALECRPIRSIRYPIYRHNVVPTGYLHQIRRKFVHTFMLSCVVTASRLPAGGPHSSFLSCKYLHDRRNVIC